MIKDGLIKLAGSEVCFNSSSSYPVKFKRTGSHETCEKDGQALSIFLKSYQ